MFRCRWGGTIRAVPERGVGKATCCQTPPDHLDLRVGRARLSPAGGESHCSLLADSRPQGLPEEWTVPTSTAWPWAGDISRAARPPSWSLSQLPYPHRTLLGDSLPLVNFLPGLWLKPILKLPTATRWFLCQGPGPGGSHCCLLPISSLGDPRLPVLLGLSST